MNETLTLIIIALLLGNLFVLLNGFRSHTPGVEYAVITPRPDLTAGSNNGPVVLVLALMVVLMILVNAHVI